MVLKLKIIKTKSFEAKGSKHTHYTAAYKGRLFGVSTMRFEGDEESLKAEDGILSISCEVEVLKNTSTDPIDGTTRVYLDLVPKAGLALADF